MIDLTGIVGIPLLKKSRFTGSDAHMCFMLEKRSEDDVTRMAAVVWPGPYCYDSTPEDVKTTEFFEFSEDGLKQAVEWMNEQSKLEKNQKIC